MRYIDADKIHEFVDAKVAGGAKTVGQKEYLMNWRMI